MEGLTEKEIVEEIIFYFILLFLSFSPPRYRILVPNQGWNLGPSSESAQVLTTVLPRKSLWQAGEGAGF